MRIFKILRLAALLHSRVFLSVFSFFLGYIFHYLLYSNKIEYQEIVHGNQADNLKYENASVILVIIIFSSINNFNRRQTIRETWLSDISSNEEVKYYFVISLKSANYDQKILVSSEQEKFNDLIILPNLEDSFHLLTQKLVASFGWLTSIPVLLEQGFSTTVKSFKNFKFLLKCDDDSFALVNNILNELKTLYSGQKGENLYWGFFDGRAKVKKVGKYKEEEWNICDNYIPYALGGGYILAYSLVQFIAKNERFLKKYNSEDICVGAWLSSYSGINRVHDPRFDTEYISRGCHQTYLITHKHSDTAMRNFHDNLKKTGFLCQKEFKTRMSYTYNWKVLPSKCCSRNNPNIP